jgi:YNFM family putative membrane transporter
VPIILFTTVLTLSALYAPQPLLPVIMQTFGVSRSAAAFLTTVSFLPLSIAPLFYGYVLESVSPRRMLRWTILLLAVSEVFFFLAPNFVSLVMVRLLQGLLVPAILTALMTYVSLVSARKHVQRAMATYIAATILGGFLGRAFSGWVAGVFGWRYSFLVLAASLLLAYFLLSRLKGETRLNLTRPHPRMILSVLRRRGFLPLYLAVFGFFLVFAAIMNFIPFRLTEISEQATEFRIGMMYSGYLMGIVASLGAAWVARRVGGEMRALRLGMIVFTGALTMMLIPSVPVLFGVMFLFCGGMFLVHSTASGLFNRCAREGQGLVNGLYVSFYYAGGAIGSYGPGPVYRHWGWDGVILALAAVSLLVLAVLMSPGPVAAATEKG